MRRNPRGKVVQEIKDRTPGLERAEFTQPYRNGVLAVWGREGIPDG